MTSLLAGIVAPPKRTSANALTNMARNTAQGIELIIAGIVTAAGPSVPFFIGGRLEILYDLAIFEASARCGPMKPDHSPMWRR